MPMQYERRFAVNMRGWCAVHNVISLLCWVKPITIVSDRYLLQNGRVFASIGWTCVMQPLGKAHSAWIMLHELVICSAFLCVSTLSSFFDFANWTAFGLQLCGKVANGIVDKMKWRRTETRAQHIIFSSVPICHLSESRIHLAEGASAIVCFLLWDVLEPTKYHMYHLRNLPKLTLNNHTNASEQHKIGLSYPTLQAQIPCEILRCKQAATGIFGACCSQWFGWVTFTPIRLHWLPQQNLNKFCAQKSPRISLTP